MHYEARHQLIDALPDPDSDMVLFRIVSGHNPNDNPQTLLRLSRSEFDARYMPATDASAGIGLIQSVGEISASAEFTRRGITPIAAGIPRAGRIPRAKTASTTKQPRATGKTKTAMRFRRTAEEKAAGMSIEQAQAHRTGGTNGAAPRQLVGSSAN